MDLFMKIVNVVIIIVLIVLIISYLISGKYGTAWICVIPLIYSLGNYVAITLD